MIRFAAAACVLMLGGCAGLMAAGAATGALGGGLAVADRLIDTADGAIRAGCAIYQRGRAAAEAVVATGLVSADAAAKVAVIEQYGDAACASPPQGDALSTAIWLGELTGQIAALTSLPRAVPLAP